MTKAIPSRSTGHSNENLILFPLLFNILPLVGTPLLITHRYSPLVSQFNWERLLRLCVVFRSFHNSTESLKFSYYTDWTYYGRYNLTSQYTFNVDNPWAIAICWYIYIYIYISF